jgi:hypothetical protein
VSHLAHTMHDNSLEAYRIEEPKLSKRAQAIYAYIERVGPRTDRQVMQGMWFTDMNNVRPRITELIDAGKLMEVTSVVCLITKKHVRLVDIRRPRQEALPL